MSAQQLTYEGVLEMLREISIETRRELQEASRLINKQAIEFEQMRKKFAREKQERDAKFEQIRQETELQMKRTDKKIGALGNRIGDIIEHMLGERIIEKFQALGYGVTHPVRRNCSFVNAKLGIEGEFDLTLVDSDVMILISVKTSLETADVRKHIEKIEEYRQHIASVGFIKPPLTHLLPSTRFIGAVAGAVVEEDAIKFAHENGLYTIVQSGDAVEIVPVPEGFKAREW